MTTAYITHPVFRRHDMGPGHPESPQRLEAIQDYLIIQGLFELLRHYEAPLASRQQLERAHPATYIDELERIVPQTGRVPLDPDTFLNPYTFEAAQRAVGAGILATDLVVQKEVTNAFCAVRPPGHHAEIAAAMGFCFFNNIACAALHALDKHRLDRVAILDFDVHHGNGTEAIFRDNPKVMVCSSFQYPFYPNTPLIQDNPRLINVPLAAGARGADFREAISDSWFPALERFRPQMIFVSAGFDAHKDDPLADLMLSERDFTWITYEIKRLANHGCEGRVVSMLEGGYDLYALGASVAAHVRELAGL